MTFFQQQVLPILRDSCFKCHGGAEEVEGSFRITSRSGVLAGGELGPAVDLADPSSSELLAAVRYESVEMPPDGKLPDAQIAVLEQWVKRGLPWSKQEDYGVTDASRPTSAAMGMTSGPTRLSPALPHRPGTRMAGATTRSTRSSKPVWPRRVCSRTHRPIASR